jgi:hypothetical protein
MTTRNVTLTLSSDLLTLGDDATSADRDQYGDNLADLLECEFDVKVHQVVGSVSRTECDDAECRSRIRDIEAGDEWTTLLGKRERPDASMVQTISGAEGYWNAVVGANRTAMSVCEEFDLSDPDDDGCYGWLRDAEREAHSQGYVFAVSQDVRDEVLGRLRTAAREYGAR